MQLIQWTLISIYLQVEAYDELSGEIRNLLVAIIMLLTLQVLMDSLRHIPWPHMFGQVAHGQRGGPNLQPVQEMGNGPAAHGQSNGQITQAQQEVGNGEDTTPLSTEETHGPVDSAAVENDEI